MAGLANLLSNAFQLPQKQQEQQQQQQQQQGLGSPQEGLQHIEGMTNDYYTKWGDAQNFAQEMMAIGIDVTKPDHRRQESRDAGNLYRKMIADLQYKGNELKNSQKMLEKFATARLSSYGADIGYGGDEQKPFDIYKAEHQGIGSVQKDANIQDRLTQQIDATADNTDKRVNAQAIQGNLNRAVQLKIAEMRTQQSKDKVTNQIKPYQPLYEDAVNLITGNTDWTQSKRTNADGKQMLKSDFWSGKRYGSYEDVSPRGAVTTKPRIVVGGLLDPSTGEVYIEFEHGAMELVDAESLSTMVSTYAESNKGYKSTDAQVFTGLLDEQELPAAQASEDQAALSQAIFEQSEKDKKALDSLWASGFLGGTKEFTLDDGTTIKMDKEGRGWGNGSGVKIKQAEALGLPDSASGDRIYTKEEAIDMLHKLGYYSGKKFQPTEAAAPAPATAAKPIPVEPSGDQVGIISQDYKTPEYQAKLKKQNKDFEDYEVMDQKIIEVAEKNNDDVDIVGAAMTIYLELGAEQLFEDWYSQAGGRQAGIDEMQESQVMGAQGDPTKL